jgi:hypothetical protein
MTHPDPVEYVPTLCEPASTSSAVLAHWLSPQLSSPALTAAPLHTSPSGAALIPRRSDLSLNAFQAVTFVVCPVEAFVVMSSIDFGDFGIQGRGSLVVGKPFRKRCLPSWPETRQRLMRFH